jgi:hypothetical protein
MRTDEMLDLLATIGRPKVARMDDGAWYAQLSFPAPEGMTVECRSDFSHPTHTSALTQLLARVGELRGVGDKVADALKGVGSPNVIKLVSNH